MPLRASEYGHQRQYRRLLQGRLQAGQVVALLGQPHKILPVRWLPRKTLLQAFAGQTGKRFVCGQRGLAGRTA